jgi:mannose-6-phosphate isomerase
VTVSPAALQPIVLPVNQIDHEYLGGDRIGALRGGPGGPQRPEEWLGSTVTRFGEAERGCTVLPSGELLRDLVLNDPIGWLGAAHAARYGSNPAILVKLLDAGERLPVHVHPTKRFAKDHLDCDYGKTEAWVVLETPPQGASVWVGCKQDTDPQRLRTLVDRQDKVALVGLLNELTVFPGDGVVVPSGTPHCTGAGAFVLELQEPTDLSVLLEWEGFSFDGPNDGHLGLGFDTALQCVNRQAFTPEFLASLVKRNGAPLVGAGSTNLMPAFASPYFRAERVCTTTAATIPASFAIIVVVEGSGTLRTGSVVTSLPYGTAVLVPFVAGPMTFEGSLTALVAMPSAADAPLAIEFDTV